ncbi:hypothetical protein F5878DRAFT_668332 [Lentinula raphanica]|uniref:Uncharacterized protein n=1 Tax=Lentinula raphanica TaxID=153919 RepID=A0AA38U1Z5_9AGAR|nr:hypothetical protein F5878DRAFT_668332 [Lentinula raphanica]
MSPHENDSKGSRRFKPRKSYNPPQPKSNVPTTVRVRYHPELPNDDEYHQYDPDTESCRRYVAQAAELASLKQLVTFDVGEQRYVRWRWQVSTILHLHISDRANCPLRP